MLKSKNTADMFLGLPRKASRLIDWKTGAISGIIIGTIVFFINVMAGTSIDYVSSSAAGIKQAVYTLFVGGFIQQISNWFALKPGSLYVAVSLATIIPGAIAASLVYFIHARSGTPHPFLSTAPIILLSLTVFPILAIANRNRHIMGAADRRK